MERAFLIIDGHQTLVVVHLGKHLASFGCATALIQGTGIDVLHHILIYGLDELAGCLLPEVNVVLMATQYHVAAHIEQGMLRAQFGLGFANGIGAYRLQVAFLGVYVLRSGVVPLVLLALFNIYAVQVFLQVL